MSKRPWMPLYTRDYLTKTNHLTTAEHGAYLLLIMHYWDNGGLPDNDELVRRITRMTPRQWSHSRDIIRSFFGDHWCHQRCNHELAQVIEKSRSASAKAQLRHNRSMPPASSQHMPETCDSDSDSDSHLERVKKKESCRIEADPTSQIVQKPKSKPRLAYDDQFETFWKDYPTSRNMSKKEAWDVWKRLSPEDRALAIAAVPKYKVWLAGQGAKAPEVIHACRFLSKRRFDGHAQAVNVSSPTQFYAAFGSPELDAWDAYGRMTKGTTFPKDRKGGWSFESRWPPGFDPGEQKLEQEQSYAQ